MKGQEIEVKFYIADLAWLEERLQALGARLVQPRTYETNLRFDTPQGDLRREHRVLRLRQDTAARLTYKGPGYTEDGVRTRQEIEFTVGDFEAAEALIQALGYEISMLYEKYRVVYDLDEVLVTLDELPYGNFAEIEGPDQISIRAVNQRLGLDWGAHVSESYIMLFERLCRTMGLEFRDLSFANFEALEIGPQELNLLPADVPKGDTT